MTDLERLIQYVHQIELLTKSAKSARRLPEAARSRAMDQKIYPYNYGNDVADVEMARRMTEELRPLLVEKMVARAKDERDARLVPISVQLYGIRDALSAVIAGASIDLGKLVRELNNHG